MNFYVWCDESCDNVTESIREAIQWMEDFRQEGRDSYIVDLDNNVLPITLYIESAGLLEDCEPTDNPEYWRALVEVCQRASGWCDDQKVIMQEMLVELSQCPG
jgi:hypothetical protein